MRQARRLLPYAGLSVFVVIASVVALLLSTLQMPVGGRDTSASASPTASAAVRPATDLSPAGRLAYWRSEPNGDYLLWVANTDGSRRRSIAKSEPRFVSHTRWSRDGAAVAYVEEGTRLVVVRLDGTPTVYPLPADLRAASFVIADARFSPSGSRIAATVQRANGFESDVYLAAPGGTWTRLTDTTDVVGGDWISDDELLVSTETGVLAVLEAGGRDQLRPIASVPGSSPILGDDGRVYFLGGAGVVSFSIPFGVGVFSSSPAVWSMTLDGAELRRESVVVGDPDNFRLEGMWPGGYLIRRQSGGGALVVSASGTAALPESSGAIARAYISGDRRYAIGFGSTGIVRMDITANGTVANAIVLLGSVDPRDADVWFPHPVAVARAAPGVASLPPGRYAFWLGGHLWTMTADGAATLMGPGTEATTLSNLPLPPPRWSPRGDRVLTLEPLGAGAPISRVVPVIVAADGSRKRYATLGVVNGTATWSADGSRFVAAMLPLTTGGTQDPYAQDLVVSTVDVATGSATTTAPGREAIATAAGIFVLSNGTYGAGARTGQAIELWKDGSGRQVVMIATLAADPRAELPARQTGIVATRLSAAPDGAYLAIQVTFAPPGSGGAGGAPPSAFVVVRAQDGVATLFVAAADAAVDEAWSPAGRLIGYTRVPGRPPYGGTPPHAIVRDAETGDVLLDAEGQFAGWSADGSWAFVRRSDGLYGRPVHGGGGVARLSPYGAAVSATMP